MKRVRIKIFGNVVGVFFRANIKKKALELGLKGFVKNVNGTVEGVFEGSESSIKEILEFCEEGPIGADVEKVEVKEEEFKGEFEDFKIEY